MGLVVEPPAPDEEVSSTVGGSGGSGVGTVLLLAAFALLLLTFLRARRAQRDTVDTQNRLVVGLQVMTTSGLYATVVDLDEDGVVTLETAPGQRSRWDRRAVARIVESPAAVQSGPGAADNPTEDGASEPPGDQRTGDEAPPPGRE